jgi:hypothetical protein
MPTASFVRVKTALYARQTFTTVTDKLSVFGIYRGDEHIFIPFKGSLVKGLYSLWIRGTKRYIVIRLKACSQTRPLKIGGEYFAWSELKIIGEICKADAILDASVIG